jgi:hypothetical protein
MQFGFLQRKTLQYLYVTLHLILSPRTSTEMQIKSLRTFLPQQHPHRDPIARARPRDGLTRRLLFNLAHQYPRHPHTLPGSLSLQPISRSPRAQSVRRHRWPMSEILHFSGQEVETKTRASLSAPFLAESAVIYRLASAPRLEARTGYPEAQVYTPGPA